MGSGRSMAGRQGVTEIKTMQSKWSDAAALILAFDRSEDPRTDVSADQLTVVCVTTDHAQEHGMVEGTGPRVVHLLNSGNYHFDPLLPADE